MDDLTVVGESRAVARMRVNEMLERPLEKKAAGGHDVDSWGHTPEAIMAAEQADTMFSQWEKIPEAVSA